MKYDPLVHLMYMPASYKKPEFSPIWWFEMRFVTCSIYTLCLLNFAVNNVPYTLFDKSGPVCSTELAVITGLRQHYLLTNGINFLVPSLGWNSPGTKTTTKNKQTSVTLWSCEKCQWTEPNGPERQGNLACDGNDEKSSLLLPESNFQSGESSGGREKQGRRNNQRRQETAEGEGEWLPTHKGLPWVLCPCWGGCTLTCANGGYGLTSMRWAKRRHRGFCQWKS